MDYPKHTPLVAAAVAAAIGGYGAFRPQTITVAAPHMIAVGPHEHAERSEPRDKCEAACAHLKAIHCPLGDSLFCVPALQTGTAPAPMNVAASCEQIATEDRCP